MFLAMASAQKRGIAIALDLLVLFCLWSPAFGAAAGGCGGHVKFTPDKGKPVLKFADISSGQMKMFICVVPLLVTGIGALIFVVIARNMLMAQPTGTSIGAPKVDYLAEKIKSGSKAFLFEEYKYLAVYVAMWFVVMVALFTFEHINYTDKNDHTDGIRTGCCFLLGALLSGFSGYVGMTVATEGNSRTAVACASKTLNDGLRVAFMTGSAMGFGVVGLASVGVTVLLLLMKPNRNAKFAVQYLHSFGFGASSIALFARVAGGIYTKAADVGADLVGKVEASMKMIHTTLLSLQTTLAIT
jgi:Na+/H+-translocating membrane pyrophosphatase